MMGALDVVIRKSRSAGLRARGAVNGLRVGWNRSRERLRWLSARDHLTRFEKRVYSQHGEDGIIAEIFRRIGTTNRAFVEFGVEDGSENNTRVLLEHERWSGLWIEGSDAQAAKARTGFATFPIKVESAFVTAENIGGLFRKGQVPASPDLLSVDIDGNDFWVLRSILGEFSPRVIVVEYNASFAPGESWVMPYEPKFAWDGTSYFGASLTALDRLASRYGYALVACDSMGANAFFVKKDLAAEKFSRPGDVAFHYASPKYGWASFGHPKSPARDYRAGFAFPE